MRVRNHGKYTKMSRFNPKGIGTCDYSGMMVEHQRMVRQMEYRGQGLVWTGFWVNPKFQDQPNPQNLSMLIKLDPVPLLNARPDSIIDNFNPATETLVLDVSGDTNITLTNEQFDNNQLIFTGTLTGNVTIIAPALIYNQFKALNNTDGGYTLSMTLNNNSSPTIVLTPGLNMSLSNDCIKLRIIYAN